MLNLLTDPITLFVLILTVGIVGNFVLVSREAAIQLSLRRYGIAGEAKIVKQHKRHARSGPSFWITYEFVEFTTSQTYRREASVSLAHYHQWKIGDTVRTVVLAHNPRISRLADDKVYIVSLFGAGAISLVFPVYFFGIRSILTIFIACIIIF